MKLKSNNFRASSTTFFTFSLILDKHSLRPGIIMNFDIIELAAHFFEVSQNSLAKPPKHLIAWGRGRLRKCWGAAAVIFKRSSSQQYLCSGYDCASRVSKVNSESASYCCWWLNWTHFFFWWNRAIKPLLLCFPSLWSSLLVRSRILPDTLQENVCCI